MTGSLTREGPKISFSLLRATAGSLSGEGPSGDRRDDRNLVPLPQLRLQAGAEPNILIVEVDVDELAQLAALIKQAVLEAWIAGVERLDGRAEVGAAHLDGDL